MLKDKYIEKEKAGKLAEKNNFFNSAVSLYYYNIYLRLKYYLNNKQIQVPVLEKSSHKTLIETFKNEIVDEFMKKNKSINFSELKFLNDIQVLSYRRKLADYDENFVFNDKNYTKDFKDYYIEVNKILKSKGI